MIRDVASRASPPPRPLSRLLAPVPVLPKDASKARAAKASASHSTVATDALAALNWHHAVGSLIRTLDEPGFWDRLMRTLGAHVPLGNWVCMRFDLRAPPSVLAVCEGPADALQRFEGYLRTAYLIDPFYVAVRDTPDLLRQGFVTLDEVAPDKFASTDYYRHYFRLNVMVEEVQFLVPEGARRWLSLSLGGPKRFTPSQLGALRLVAPWVLALMARRGRTEEAAQRNGESPATLQLPATSGLTAREREVMHLMLGGNSSKLIARRLGISEETVKVHRRHLYAKFEVSTQSQLFSIFLSRRT